MTQENKACEPKSKQVPVVSSGELLGPSRQLKIEHKGEIYTLRVTSNEKLILTK